MFILQLYVFLLGAEPIDANVRYIERAGYHSMAECLADQDQIVANEDDHPVIADDPRWRIGVAMCVPDETDAPAIS